MNKLLTTIAAFVVMTIPQFAAADGLKELSCDSYSHAVDGNKVGYPYLKCTVIADTVKVISVDMNNGRCHVEDHLDVVRMLHKDIDEFKGIYIPGHSYVMGDVFTIEQDSCDSILKATIRTGYGTMNWTLE